MKTGTLRRYACTVAVMFLLAVLLTPLYATAKEAKMEGEVTGQVVCLFEWIKGPEYQGSDSKCPNANHDRSLITDKGEIVILEPDDKAGQDVIKLVRTPDLERRKITAEGELIEKGGIKILKVKKFKVLK